MIMVDVFVPVLNNQYNFKLNDECPIGMVIEEIADMVAQKERTQLVGDKNKLELCVKKDKRMLSKKKTLSECGIENGSLLMLI